MTKLTTSKPADDTLLHDGEVIPGRNGGTLKPIRSSERARELVAAREAKKQRAIRAGVAKAGLQVPEIARADPYAVIQAAAEHHALNSLDPSAPGSHRSLELLLKHGWPAPEPSTNGSPQAVAAASFGIEAARMLLAKLRQYHPMWDEPSDP